MTVPNGGSREKKWSECVENEVLPKTKDQQISENNILYAKWWITTLASKIDGVMNVVKNYDSVAHTRKYWAKFAVRLKLYNSLNGVMEEHSLLDLVLYILRNNENKIPSLQMDSKKQCNVVGTYYVSYDIYSYIVKSYENAKVEVVSEETKVPVVTQTDVQ
tara:strand:- start:1616 stop:2098 length:483 start_codon:yes stop_codon:yes gene_type:complete